ncbi:uncharacterized protein LOC124919474 [Impatiens glandulifera]|uniref:uncharacterized protein LOC124919474 n=1 Tax=Impatiens glandulifera TaxID=253017 RepID=UPI001FB15A8E|nr:uncharacterized protein LOC124919474 [Impatiens glandulifera]
MARKGSQQKNGLDHCSENHKKVESDRELLKGKASQGRVVTAENTPNSNKQRVPGSETVDNSKNVGIEKKSKKRLRKSSKKEKVNVDVLDADHQETGSDNNSVDCVEKVLVEESTGLDEEIQTDGSNHFSKNINSSFNCLLDRLHTLRPAVEHSKASILSFVRASNVWLEKQKPTVLTLRTKIQDFGRVIGKKFEHAYPIILRCLVSLGNIMLLLSVVWLDCAFRGIESFIHMGTASFFSVVWCSIFTIIAMIGLTKFTIAMVATVLTFFLGFSIGTLLTVINGIVFMWFYGSFWITGLVICAGGVAFMFSHGRVALLIATLYSVYCLWTSLGWLYLVLALNLSFISSDALVFFLKNNINEHRNSHPEQTTAGAQGHPSFFNSEPEFSSSETANSPSDRSSGMASTSGADSEVTSEDEVVRLLNCTDHYSILGLSRHEDVDVTLLKKEYRKKAMLVHPDKNMGNEKAAEAFKKLQNAYEVLLDSIKRKAYDNELRRDELLNYFRKFQDTSSKNGRQGFFQSRFSSEADSMNPLEESRHIACRKCGNFHVWIHTKKVKSTARWCQDCKEFHLAKDGDGWVEQASQPFFFGILQKVDFPRAFICVDNKIYDATEWYMCQGMTCGVNTHKPSFHVNTTSVGASSAKHNSNGKGTGQGQRGKTNPSSSNVNMDEGMTEEEFFEWLQNAMQSGQFRDFSDTMPTDNSPKTGNSKSGGSSNNNNGSSNNNNAKRKKGKKQR